MVHKILNTFTKLVQLSQSI